MRSETLKKLSSLGISSGQLRAAISSANIIVPAEDPEPVIDPEPDPVAKEDGKEPVVTPFDNSSLIGDDIDTMPPEPKFTVEIMPHFKKCFSANANNRDKCTEERILKHLERNLTIPDGLKKNIRTTVTFVIETSGNVGKIHCAPRVPKSVQHEIERVLKKMPQMEPGIQQGHKVPVYYQIPISVKLI